jgi:N-acetylmuramoyl-L-alanine amidase
LIALATSSVISFSRRLPSVLFETGYISNLADAAFLASNEGQQKVAQSVRKAVEIHFATRMASR